MALENLLQNIVGKLETLDDAEFFSSYKFEFTGWYVRARRLIREAIKFSLPIIPSYYDGKESRNPFINQYFEKWILDSMHIACSPLLASGLITNTNTLNVFNPSIAGYEHDRLTQALLIWSGITALNFISHYLGYKMAVREERKGERKYDNGKTIYTQK